jgi:serine/threonine protein kinase
MSDVFGCLKDALAERYYVEGRLGSGGMAVVYRARDLRHERRVAIKVLRPELASVVAAERFLREIKLTAGLSHPHILPLLDSGEADGHLYYVMPYVEGESLRERLNREKQLSVESATRIAREVADALSYAHKHDVLHRDIKPENILIGSGHAVVADFGIAKAISEAGGDTLTQIGVAVGTPAYMSPEQASGNERVDERSEIYSLACVLYEMLAGEPPFAGQSAQAIIARHMMSTPPPLKLLRPTVPEHLAKVVERGLAKAPADRFTSACEFLRALDTPLARELPNEAESGPLAEVGANAGDTRHGAMSVPEWFVERWTLLRRQHFFELLLAWAVIALLATLFILSVVEYFSG